MALHRHPESPLLDHCPESLPVETYFDPAWYRREQKAIWAKNWVYAGRKNDLRKGTMRRITVGGQNVLLCRDRAGAGVEVDFSHMDVMWCQMAEGILTADHERRDLGRIGNREPGVAVSGIFPCRDGRWVAVIGGPETRSLVERSATMDPAEFVGAIVATADGNRAEIVNGCLDVAGDARFADRFETVDHPVTGPVLQVRAPFVIDGERCASRGPAPMFDQHTDAVLSERLGYTAERIRALRDEKVVGGTLPTPW